MRKIRLDVDALEIETFDTGAVSAGERGTVHAQQRTTFQTIQISCDYTAAYETCHAPCECTNANVRCKNP